MIPGAAVGTMCADFPAANLNANVFCGNSQGLAKTTDAAAAANTGTICSMLYFSTETSLFSDVFKT